MNPSLQNILKLAEESDNLSEEQKKQFTTWVKEADKQLTIIEFKLDRTEKVKKTTAILLEETIEELEQKRKAVEAQNKDLEIEAALERVRSRSMSMHKSDELKDVIRLVLEQFAHLKINAEHAGFYIDYKAHDDMHIWLADPNIEPFYAIIPYFDTPTWNSFLEAKAKETAFHTDLLDFEEKNRFYNSLFKLFTVPEEAKEFYLRCKGLAVSTVLLDSVGLYIENFSGIPYSDEENKILMRFGKVFQQTYTRFLDLQKAEAQAREAQVQLALERVRARTMAMHESSELNATAELLFDQLRQLGFEMQGVAFAICDENSIMIQKWTSIGIFSHPYTIEAGEQRMYEAWKNKEPIYEEVYEGERIKKYFGLFMEIPAFKEGIQKFIEAGYPLPTWQKNHAVPFKYGYLLVITTKPYTETEIFLRFAKVFEQTYTRFLDLQKAEAQAREGQIQLALERVRARTMAMQKSDELGEAASLLFKQIRSLDIEPYASGFTIWESDDKELVSWMCNADGSVNPPFRMPAQEIEWHRQQYKSWKNKEEYVIHDFTGNEMQDHYKYLRSFPLLNEAFKKSEAAGVATPVRQVHNAFNFTHGNLLFITLQQVPHAYDIFKRFAIVFDQTYTRFLDLKKAEAQAREGQIQLALERVRARTMAMQKSDELAETAVLLFHQLMSLELNVKGCGFNIWEKEEKTCTSWMSGPDGELSLPFSLPLSGDPLFIRYYESRQNGEDFFVHETGKEELVNRYKHLQTLPVLGEAITKELEEGKEIPSFVVDHVVNFSKGNLIFITYERCPAEWDIFKRFGKVFEQTYTRFLDLQRAEAQTREALIEAALERIRSAAMAMHSSADILHVTHILREQISLLGEKDLESILVHIYNEDANKFEAWYSYRHPKSQNGEIINGRQILDWSKTARARKDKENYYQKDSDYTIVADHAMLKEWYEYLFAIIPEVVEVDGEGKILIPDALYYNYSKISGGALLLITNTEASLQAKDLLKRAAKVFNLAYSRFLDLQKAETQARESQIELSLERVRAKTMAMHNSADVGETAAVMEGELKKLGIDTIRCGIGIMHEPGNMEIWTIRNIEDSQPNIIIGWMDMHIHPLLTGAFESWRNKNESYSYELTGDDLINYFKAINNYPGYPIRYDMDTLPPLIHHNEFTFTEGILFAFSLEQLKEEQRKIFKRFAGVFGQTYRRYLDLKKAEAQAREAKIEAAMEKVRARAMAMQKPAELVEVAELLRTEMSLLGVEELETSSIYIHHEESGLTKCWFAIRDVRDGDKKLIADYMNMQLKDTWVGREMLRFYSSDEKQISILMQGENRKEWINYCAAHSSLLQGYYGDVIPERTYHLIKFSNGFMGAASPGDISTESWDLLKRATNVFSLAYTRFSDLQLAEAQAREAQVETALERVRSRTLAMQKSDELAETAAEVFKQLISLGMEPNRLYIGIVNGDTKDMEMWATDEDGTGVGKKFTFNASDNASVKKLYDGWAEKIKSVTVDMQGVELENYIGYLQRLQIPLSHALTQKRRVQSVAYFDKGFIGMASPDEQSESSIHLLERFAAVFNLTFTRFNDLKIAEAHALQAEQDLIEIKAARKKAEDTLTELQATQKQLIQSEKMASLGELTAGIAHEIQNPLNFVNNFSEINNELIEEMKQELNKGDIEEAKYIIEDIKQNLEKINHHGKRADSIVKGMLQHSQRSAGEKMPTDINALADEYLRLAYHGIRAKDKSFNAKLETDFDTQIGKVNIIPQDIGRVVLNILTNAFYAVNEKKKADNGTYHPTVLIKTKKINDTIEIVVNDNGNGIPKNIVDKIFQPFFTTKPTGQGTGLGLSLAYDIVKAHGGEIKVKAKEGEGSEFVIQLALK